VAEILRANGLDATAKNLRENPDLAGYDRLILGGPIHGMKIIPEFHSFLRDKALASGKTTDIFIISYLFERGRKMWREAVRKHVESLRSEIQPESMEVFGGRLPDALPAFARILFGTPRDLPLDIRDWKKIGLYAESLAKRIGSKT